MEESQNQENFTQPGKHSGRFISFLAWTGIILSLSTCVISGYFHQVLPSSLYFLIIPGTGLFFGLSLHLKKQIDEGQDSRKSIKTFCYLLGSLEIVFSLMTTGLLICVCLIYYHQDIGDNLGLQVLTKSACRNCHPFMFIYKDITVRSSNQPEINFKTRGLAIDIYFILSVGLLIFSSLLLLGVRVGKFKLVLSYLVFKMLSYLGTGVVLVLAVVDNTQWREHFGSDDLSSIGVVVMSLYIFFFVYINGFPLMLLQLHVGNIQKYSQTEKKKGTERREKRKKMPRV